MARLTLLIGPAGCGKTHRVLTEVAQCALAGPLPTETTPPLLVIVPEQQAAGTERALLARITELAGGQSAACARLNVMSLTRLARILGERTGAVPPPLGDLGRRLMIWRMLEGGSESERRARAEAFSDAVAELALYGTGPDDLERRAEELAAGQHAGAALAGKLRELARIARGCQSECSSRGLAYGPAPALLPELLNESNWPHLHTTRVWVDGFAGFTPAEESALLALMRNCAAVTATVLLDPARRSGPLDGDTIDWYAPTRQTYRRWLAIAGDAPATVDEVPLDPPDLPRWPQGSPLADLARPGSGRPAAGTAGMARAVVLASERAEVDHCARTILDLVNGRGYRFNEISVVARSLEPYADLFAVRFGEHGIPCYLDRRESAARHPLVEQVRCGLRLALGQAAEDDVYTLLKGGLLPGADPSAGRDRGDRLENYARAHGLRPHHWLRERTWEWRERILRREGDDAGRAALREEQAIVRAAEYDSWRRELLAPVIALHSFVRAAGQPTIAQVLGSAWENLAGPAVQAELENWAAAAETATTPDKPAAALHRGIAAPVAGLFDEIHSLAGEALLGRGGISAAELCTWLEYGLGSLSLGQPPLNLDSVLVTEVERGRHHPVKATLLLGLAEDGWPPPAQETALFSDTERELINAGGADGTGRGLTGGGAAERGGREPYLALVALTRAAGFLQLSRPGADARGSARPPSPYYKHCLREIGLTEDHPPAGTALSAGTPADIACWAGINNAAGAVADLLAGGNAHSALDWGRAYSGSATGLDPLDRGTIESLTAVDGTGRPVLRGSTSRLEAFAACPFKHFARYFLGLRERDEALFDQRTLGSLYHEVLQHTITALNSEGHHWPGRPEEVYRRSLQVLDEAITALEEESGFERSAHLADRARLVLWHQAHELCRRLEQYRRSPRATELAIGGHSSAGLPPLVIESEAFRLELSGFIDRLDGGRGGLTVVDYKFKGGEVRWDRFLAGAQIQLFAYLLATAEAREQGAIDAGSPEGVEYQPIEAGWDDGGCATFQAKSEPPRKPDGTVAEKHEGVLEHGLREVRRVMTELSGRIIAGEIAPLPLSWQNGRQTACGLCDYRGACRFDPQGGETYREVHRERNDKLRERVAGGEEFTGSALAGLPEVES